MSVLCKHKDNASSHISYVMVGAYVETKLNSVSKLKSRLSRNHQSAVPTLVFTYVPLKITFCVQGWVEAVKNTRTVLKVDYYRISPL